MTDWLPFASLALSAVGIVGAIITIDRATTRQINEGLKTLRGHVDIEVDKLYNKIEDKHKDSVKQSELSTFKEGLSDMIELAVMKGMAGIKDEVQEIKTKCKDL